MNPTETFPNFRLNGKTALVTGAARGLGRAIFWTTGEVMLIDGGWTTR